MAWAATSRCGRRSTPPSRASGRRSRTSPRWRRRSGPRSARPTTTSAIRIGPSRQIERAYKLRRRSLGPDHADTLQAADDLAHIYLDRGRLDEALALLTESLNRRKAALGTDHPDTLTSKHNLASVYQAAGRLDEALPLYARGARAAPGQAGQRPPRHLVLDEQPRQRLPRGRPVRRGPAALRGGPPTAAGRARPRSSGDARLDEQPGEFLSGAGRLPEAISLLAEALRRQDAKLGPDHPDTLFSMSNLGQIFAASMVQGPGGPLQDPNDCAGLGCESYQFLGHRVIEKNGALNGVRTIVTLVPERNIGIAVFANKQLTVFPEAVRAEFLERVLGQVGTRPAEANSRRTGRVEYVGCDPKAPSGRQAITARSECIHRPLREPILRIPGRGPRGRLIACADR